MSEATSGADLPMSAYRFAHAGYTLQADSRLLLISFASTTVSVRSTTSSHTHRTSTGCPPFRCAQRRKSLTRACLGISSSRPAHRGRLRRRARAERDAASCGLARNHAPGRRPGKTALPPLRAERANAPMRDRRAPLMCNARRFRQGGLGAKKSPRWSAERRASSRERREGAIAHARLRAYVTRPPTGAAAPGRLSALRPLAWCEGKIGKARRSS